MDGIDLESRWSFEIGREYRVLCRCGFTSPWVRDKDEALTVGRIHSSDNPGEIARVARRRAAEQAGPLHAHEVSPDDAALMRALGGTAFDAESTVTLPSGRVVTGEEVRLWCGTDNQHQDEEA